MRRARTVCVFAAYLALAAHAPAAPPARTASLLSVAALVDWTWLSQLLPFRPWRTRLDDDVCPIAAPQTHAWIPEEHDNVAAPKKQAWEAALGGQEAARPHIQARLVGWPQRALVDRQSLPHSDADFVRRVALDTWRGLDALSDRENGLPMDTVRLAKESVALDDSHIGDYASSSDIGLRLTAIVAAYELEFISQAEAIDKIRRVLDTLDRLETYRGFLFNYYDTTSLERTSNFVSFVDSSWLTAGLMVVRMTFAELSDRCSHRIAQTDYGFFYDPAKQLVSHGYYVNRGAPSPFDYGALYTEARLGSLIAIGKGDVPEDEWFAMLRTFPSACRWQSQRPQANRIKTVRGHQLLSGYYEWNGVRYVPSWGGSMFEALMPTVVLDERALAPRSLGANDLAHAVVQRRYALETLAYPVWGISSSATTDADGYAECGIPVLGTRGYAAGPVTPHASALALSVTPEPAIANLRALADRYAIYGEYGFYDAVDPHTGSVAYTYLALDQSMLFLALANHIDDQVIQKRFAADPIVQKALPIIAAEDFVD